MTIKFIPPNQSGKNILNELDKIVEALQRKPDPILEKNKKFLKNFLRGMFSVSKKNKSRMSLPFQPMTNFQPMQNTQIPTQKPKLKPKLQQPLPPPPVPTTGTSPPQNFKKQNNVLEHTKQEPKMVEKDWKLYNKVASKVQKDPENKDEIIRKTAQKMNLEISQPYIDKMNYYLDKNFRKYDVLTPLLEEPRIQKINVNSFDDIPVMYDNESLPTRIKFNSKKHLINFQKLLLNKFNKNIPQESQINIKTPEFNISGIYSTESPTLEIEKTKQ